MLSLSITCLPISNTTIPTSCDDQSLKTAVLSELSADALSALSAVFAVFAVYRVYAVFAVHEVFAVSTTNQKRGRGAK